MSDAEVLARTKTPTTTPSAAPVAQPDEAGQLLQQYGAVMLDLEAFEQRRQALKARLTELMTAANTPAKAGV